MKSTKLTGNDVPEAPLGDREPEKFKMAELRVWLQCRVARGLSKADCELYRCHAVESVGYGHRATYRAVNISWSTSAWL